MTKKTRKTNAQAPSRLRSEIIEMAGDLNAVGLMSDGNLDKITMRMLDKEKLPNVEPLTADEIRRVRERAGVSQAVFARYLNLTVSYVSQLERGEKHPTGATAKLLDVIRRKGIEAIL
jgi:putative transcriptional regulator